MSQPRANVRRRTPRRQGRHSRLAAAVEDALGALDELDRLAPLPGEFVAGLAVLYARAKGVLARTGAELAPGPVEAGPMAPGAALVMLLKLHLALEQAAKNAGTRGGRRRL